jgi:hypothetical protein
MKLLDTLLAAAICSRRHHNSQSAAPPQLRQPMKRFTYPANWVESRQAFENAPI